MLPRHEKQAVARYGRVKLPDEKVLEVFRRRLAGATLQTIAAEFGIHFVYVQAVVKGDARATAFPDHPLRLKCVSAEREKREAYRRRSVELHAPGVGYDAAVRDYRRGYSLRAAAARHGLTFNHLRRVCIRRRVKLRAPSKRSKFCHDSKGATDG
ncbi:MAG TPA: hypothetical protein VD866_04580 [Urbifossiella sp.]|nr:hypothetical protein [Urbifossiella sp.]